MIFHLSHNDLDGYFCQYLSSLKYDPGTVAYFNANYPDVTRTLQKIRRKIKAEDSLVITDLNLKPPQIQIIEEILADGIPVQLYDHHITETMRPWMTVDTSRSASAIYAEAIGVKTPLLSAVDSYDMWREENDLDVGAALTEIINRDWLFLSSQEEAEFYHHVFRKIEGSSEIIVCDSELVRSFLELSTPVVAPRKLLAERYAREKPLEVSGGKYVISFEMSSFQYYSSEVLKHRPDLVLVNISKNGGISFRSREENVEELARFYFQGGGHRCAAGGYIGKTVEDESEARELFLSKAPKG